jgi:hypothetical protein
LAGGDAAGETAGEGESIEMGDDIKRHEARWRKLTGIDYRMITSAWSSTRVTEDSQYFSKEEMIGL